MTSTITRCRFGVRRPRHPTKRELLQDVLEHVRRTGDPTVPWEEIPELAAEFRDREAVLCELQRRWHERFAARLDALMEAPPRDFAQAVRELWAELAAEDPTWRSVLDAHHDHPALAYGLQRQRLLLAEVTLGELTRLPYEPDRKPGTGQAEPLCEKPPPRVL